MSELSASFDLPAGTAAPAAARHAITSMLQGWGFHDPEWIQRAQLIVSEVVTNAVIHGGACLSLELQAHHGTVTIAAVDGSSVVPRPRPADDNGGRGIRLIEAMSARWGVHDHEGGKRVWIELLPHPPTVGGPTNSSTGRVG